MEQATVVSVLIICAVSKKKKVVSVLSTTIFSG